MTHPLQSFFFWIRTDAPFVVTSPDHRLRLHHSTRVILAATCSCGRWTSQFSLNDVPVERTGDVNASAARELCRRHQVRVAAERRDLP